MKMKSIEKVLLSLILFSIIGFTFITSGNLFQREATIITLLICIFLFWSYLRSNFFDEINDFEFILNKFNYSILFGAIFIINLLFQNAYLNFETIDWDISSYLVVSNEINQDIYHLNVNGSQSLLCCFILIIFLQHYLETTI